jgi:Mg2+/Co2+ transporter CorB
LDDIPLSVLFGVLFFLIILSAFFSSSETGLMTLNRYRLRHLVRAQHKGAIRAQKLLERPDRLIGLILLGNNFVNILASSLTTIIALRLGGEAGIAIGAGLLTLIILIFAEVTPKTLAALHPERVAFPAAFVYGPLLWLLYPLVWIVNSIANTLLKLFGIRREDSSTDALSQEELRTVVLEAGAMIPKRHQDMLLNIIDLEKVTVEDIMVPRKEITGINLEDEWETIVRQITNSQYTRDILEEVVGEFTTDPSASIRDYTAEKDGSFLVIGTASVRDLNRDLNMELPTDGPKTLNGMVLEYLEDIPEPGTSLLLSGYPVDIVQTKGNLIKTLRVHVNQRRPSSQNHDR